MGSQALINLPCLLSELRRNYVRINIVKIPAFFDFPTKFPSAQLGKVGFLLCSIFFGQWFLADVVHIPGGGLGLLVAGYVIWFFSQPSSASFESPSTVKGWIRRCREVLEQFEAFDDQDSDDLKLQQKRSESLNDVINRSGPQNIAFVHTTGVQLPERDLVKEAMAVSSCPLKLSWPSPLHLKEKSSIWPTVLFEQDAVVYFLSVPLRAADLLWLKEIPEDQPAWVFVQWNDVISWIDQLEALHAQLPDRFTDRILHWNGENDDIYSVLSPVRSVLDQQKRNLNLTRQRLLAKLHSSWQADLEQLRRQKFLVIQQRNQWIVAGAVFASPVPSTDLLVLAVVNGLMIQDMAKIWSCPWRAEALQLVAKQLAGAALAQGVVEWSGQALLGAAKLHGSGWLAAGTIQALSAAYLTRVVGRSMSDWMALNNGVSEPDLEALKRHAPELVANAAQKERIDWSGFLRQSNNWIIERSKEPSMSSSLVQPCQN